MKMLVLQGSSGWKSWRSRRRNSGSHDRFPLRRSWGFESKHDSEKISDCDQLGLTQILVITNDLLDFSASVRVTEILDDLIKFNWTKNVDCSVVIVFGHSKASMAESVPPSTEPRIPVRNPMKQPKIHWSLFRHILNCHFTVKERKPQKLRFFIVEKSYKNKSFRDFHYRVRRFVQIRSQRSMISLPQRYLDPPSIPLIQSRWPNPLQWINPCKRWVWRSKTPSSRGGDTPIIDWNSQMRLSFRHKMITPTYIKKCRTTLLRNPNSPNNIQISKLKRKI